MARPADKPAVAVGVGGGTALPIAECRLDLDGLRAQRDRYRALGRHVKRLERGPGRLDAWLGPEVDVASGSTD